MIKEIGSKELHPRNRDKVGTGSRKSRLEEIVTKVLQKVDSTKAGVKDLRSDGLIMNQVIESCLTSIKYLG